MKRNTNQYNPADVKPLSYYQNKQQRAIREAARKQAAHQQKMTDLWFMIKSDFIALSIIFVVLFVAVH